MAKRLLKSRTILESFAQFNLSSSSIRSLALFSKSLSETLIYVGTVSGNLLLLSLHNPDSNSSSSSSNNNHENNGNDDKLKFVRHMLISDRAVESIHIFGEIEKVLVLSDGYIHFVDLELVKPVKKIAALKDVSIVARRLKSNKNEVFSKLTVGGGGDPVGGSSFLQRLGGGSGGGRLNGGGVNDLPIDDNCVFAAAIGKKLILVGLVGRSNENYDSVAGSLVTLKEITCVDLIKDAVWINDSIIVGSSSGYYLCSCVTGKCGLIFSLPDLSTPQLKVLKKDYNVLMLVDNVGIIIDSHGQPVGGSLVFHGSPDGIGEMGSSVVALHGNTMELRLKKSGNCVQKIMVSGTGDRECVITDDEDGMHKMVVVAASNKVICYMKVASEEQIKHFLRKKDFKEAVALVEELYDDGEITNLTLSLVHAQVGFLLMFDLHFEEAVNHFLLSETMQPSEIFPFIMPDPNRWSLLVPRNRYWGLHPPPAPLESVIDNGLMAIQRAIFLKKAGLETAVDDEFLLNPPNRDDLLDSAIKNLIRYLKASREKDLTSSVKEGVDTLLMYLYRALNFVDEMENLASSENWCIVEELETLLNNSGHLRTLAFLCESKKMSSKALAIWRILARNYSSGFWKDPIELNENKDLIVNINIISGKETAATEATRILEELSDQNLILQHLGWIADISQVLAVRVLTSEKRSDQLPPDKVIAAIDPKKTEIIQRYLQWLIEDQGSDDPQFHSSYAQLLTKSALETYEPESPSREPQTGQINGSKNSIFQNPVREILQVFLQSSDLYDPEEVLYLIQESELWLEKAILYRKLGQESLVLQILAVKLEDSDAAEHYCAEIGRPDAYMQLLDIYLNPTDGKQPMFKAAVRLLHNHGESLDPLQVLERLSPSMPLQLASDTILRMLRARLHHHYQGQVVHNLSRAVGVDASLARFEERSRHVQINDESLCDSCHARLGTKLFAMYPDDTIVCYKCFRRQGESTSVTGRDFNNDPVFKPGWLVTE